MKVPVMNVVVVVVVVCWCAISTVALPDVILIGGLFDQHETQQDQAFKYAVSLVNQDNNLLPRSQLIATSIILTNDDSFHSAKKVCNLLREGVAAIFGPRTENAANHVQSICDAMDIPHIETRWHYTERRDESSINLHPYPPTLGDAYRDIILKLGWKKLIILYDNNESLVKLQSILKEPSWTINVYKLPEDMEYRPLMKQLKQHTRFHFVMDVSVEKIYKILDDAALVGMTDSYRQFFVTNLDFYMVNTERFRGNANITGIQVVDPESDKTKMVVEMIKMAEQYTHSTILDDMVKLSTDAALIYDAVFLFAHALTELENSNQVEISSLYCESTDSWAHGNSLVNYMKSYSSRSINSPRPPTHVLPDYNVPSYGGSGRSPSVIQSWRGGGRRGSRGRMAGPRMSSRGSSNMGTGYHFASARNVTPLFIPLDGLSGRIKFDDQGFRSDFELDIVELAPAGLQKVGKWTPKGGANFTRNWVELEETTAKMLRDKVRVVYTAKAQPYAMLKKSADSLEGNDKYEGFCIDLIKKISEELNFNYTIKIQEDGKYGNKDNATGEWNGIIKKLLDHKADMGIVDFTITYAREEAVDFTMPFMNLGISIVYKKPQKKAPSLFSFMSPFSVDVWIYMATAYLGVSVLLFMLARMVPDEWDCPYPCIEEPEELENSFTLLNSLWFIIGTFLCQGADIAPKAVSTRIVAGIWWFFTLIMISSYTANLAAFLTVERMDSPIESAEDLAKQTKIKYGCKEGGSTYDFFKDSTYPTYQKMWQTMSQARPTVFTASNNEGVERVKKSEEGQYAFLMESSTIEYVVERNCDLMRIGDLLDSKSYGIALPPDSPFTGAISKAILKLKEAGVIHKLKELWWKETGSVKCQREEKKDAASAAELGLENVGGVFVVMVGGIGLACVTACCEFIWKARKLATDEGMSFWTELRKELIFVVNCRENSKPVRKRALPENTDSSSIYGSSNYGYSGNGKN